MAHSFLDLNSSPSSQDEWKVEIDDSMRCLDTSKVDLTNASAAEVGSSNKKISYTTSVSGPRIMIVQTLRLPGGSNRF